MFQDIAHEKLNSANNEIWGKDHGTAITLTRGSKSIIPPSSEVLRSAWRLCSGKPEVVSSCNQELQHNTMQVFSEEAIHSTEGLPWIVIPDPQTEAIVPEAKTEPKTQQSL